MGQADVARHLESGQLRLDELPLVGGGDYCGAWDAGDEWLLLVAHTDEAGQSLARTARIVPRVAPRTTLAVPEPGAGGVLPDGREFLLVRRVAGGSLSSAMLGAMTPSQHDAAAMAIGRFLGEMHGLPAAFGEAAGIPIGWYPFAATEDGMRDGPAAPHYDADLAALARTSLFDTRTLDWLAALVADHLARGERDPVFLHGEVSADHVFVDPATLAVTGIIDFQGVVLGDPARDLLYLADSYGMPFVEAILRHYPGDRLADPWPALAFYRVWHLVVRLLWAAEHGYAERAALVAQRLVERSRSGGR